MKVIATIKKIKYRKDDFAIIQVGKITCDNKVIAKKIGRTCDCKLYIPCIFEDDILEMECHIENGRYGEIVLFADTSKVLSNANETATINFLKTRGGMKPKTAKLAVEEIGLNAVNKIIEDSSVLDFLKLKKGEAEKISQKLSEYVDYEAISLDLALANIPLSKANQIIAEYGKLSQRVIRTQPYKLLYNDILSFSQCDMLAYNSGIEANSAYRIQSAIYQYLNYNLKTHGNLYEDKELLNEKVNEFLKSFGVYQENSVDISFILSEEIKREALIESSRKIYRKYIYQVETETAELVKRMAKIKIPVNMEEIQNDEDFLKLDPQQQKAVINSMGSKFSLIAGFAGSGKTTSIKTLLKLCKNKKVRLLAPTGKASERMTEATGHQAETIHRALKLQVDSFNTDEIITEDIVIVDESTMIDIQLFHCLISHVWGDSQIILLGDPAQLPSVGGGNVFSDLLKSPSISSITLQTVHRQAGESGILKLATQIRNCEEIEFESRSDLNFIKEKNLIKTTQNTYNELIAKYGKDSVVILSGTRKIVEQLNGLVQSEFNKNELQEFDNLRLGLGDKVMCIKNLYEKDCFNGDVGTVIGVTDNIKVEFKDEKVVEFDFEEAEYLQLAYAMTIHKSQGSEYNAVILTLDKRQKQMINKNLLYTAITRAKKELVIIYDEEETIRDGAKIAIQDLRKSRLKEKIC